MFGLFVSGVAGSKSVMKTDLQKLMELTTLLRERYPNDHIEWFPWALTGWLPYPDGCLFVFNEQIIS